MRIAIIANPNRGKEILSLLESFGGIKNTLTGNGELYTYYIDKNNVIRYDYAPKDYKVYTLEEFEKEFPFKVGDKVRIKSKSHFCSVDGFNNINMKDEFFNEYSRLPYCETVMTIGIVNKDFYILKEDRWAYKWTDEMIEGLVEDTTTNEQSFKPSNISLEKEMEWNLPKGYQFKDENGNVINAMKIVLEKKKKEYPKTYEECCKVMNYCCNPASVKTTHKEKLIRKFQFLLMYRDAYWKIAGEEMGLGKPWEPDWKNEEGWIHCITNDCGEICCTGFRGGNKILAFPTKEMRDAFKENFYPDIEICKKLL